MAYSKLEYNDEPVYYCRHCLSLKIRDSGLEDLLYCDDCAATDISKAHIDTWRKAYRMKYGKDFINK